MDNAEFENQLSECRTAVERFVYYRMPSKADGDDVLQETYLSAFVHYAELHDKSRFKPWLLAIARSKCGDYYRMKAKQLHLPLDELNENTLTQSRFGVTVSEAVRDTLELLPDKDRQILYLFYFKQLRQEDIARALGVPLGTVKSRLFNAKARFKSEYPYQPNRQKGETEMSKLPEILPEYTIVKTDKEPFDFKWEELMGWFLVPKLGEKLSWAMYDFPERRRTERCEMEVVGRAEVHGIEGVEIVAHEYEPAQGKQADGKPPVIRGFVAQLTDTHCRLLAESDTDDGVKKYHTFLDGDDFLDNWGFGDDNCGNETVLKPKGDIKRNGSVIEAADKRYLLDIVGRYTVTIGGKAYDTVCVMDIETYNSGVATEQFIDKNGRTVLWRRFNRDNWALNRYKQPWTQKLPENERITINGETYVHWYDCITDYITYPRDFPLPASK